MYKYTTQGEYTVKKQTVETFLDAGNVTAVKSQGLLGGIAQAVGQAQQVAGQAVENKVVEQGDKAQDAEQKLVELLAGLKKELTPSYNSVIVKSGGLFSGGEIKPIPKTTKVGDLTVEQLMTLMAIHDDKKVAIK